MSVYKNRLGGIIIIKRLASSLSCISFGFFSLLLFLDFFHDQGHCCLVATRGIICRDLGSAAIKLNGYGNESVIPFLSFFWNRLALTLACMAFQKGRHRRVRIASRTRVSGQLAPVHVATSPRVKWAPEEAPIPRAIPPRQATAKAVEVAAVVEEEEEEEEEEEVEVAVVVAVEEASGHPVEKLPKAQPVKLKLTRIREGKPTSYWNKNPRTEFISKNNSQLPAW